MLAAPGGFGKTTLLAAACRAEAARGVPVAWLTLADEDRAATLDAHVAFAFHHAGVDLPAPAGAGDVPPATTHPRTAMLLRALEERNAPCVLALDELERAADPESADLLGFLLAAKWSKRICGLRKGGSTNAVLHLLALAGRVGVDSTLDDWDRLGRSVPTFG